MTRLITKICHGIFAMLWSEALYNWKLRFHTSWPPNARECLTRTKLIARAYVEAAHPTTRGLILHKDGVGMARLLLDIIKTP